jgi:hypothetical protein
VPSPWGGPSSLLDRKPEPIGQPLAHVSPTSGPAPARPAPSGPCKRPLLPAKEYEETTDQLTLTSAYDYAAMSAWLSHPVKKSRPTEGARSLPLQPMFRRRSQHDIFAAVTLDAARPADTKPALVAVELGQLPVKLEPKVMTNGLAEPLQPKKELVTGDDAADNKLASTGFLLDADSLKPSMADLDNMFEDSDSDMLDTSGCVPTPPASVQPHVVPEDDGYTKVVKRDPPGNLPSDQLHHQYPTPPSHEHPGLHSPGDGGEDPRTPGSAHIKQEPASPRPEYGSYLAGQAPTEPLAASSAALLADADSVFDHTVMLPTSKFAPLPLASLPSHQLPRVERPERWCFKPAPSLPPPSPQPPSAQPSIPHTSVPSLKPGLSPISPSPSVDLNPRSNKSMNPGSCDPGFPRSVGPTTPRCSPSPTGALHLTPLSPGLGTTP